MSTKEFIKKIKNYDLLNIILPGVLYVVFLDKFTNYNLIQENIMIGIFLYYFIGVVVSRVGSLLVGPVLNLDILLTKEKEKDSEKGYEKFILASKEDGKIELLLEVRNMYRTLISLFVLIFFSKIYEFIMLNITINPILHHILIILFFILIFMLSYRKQNNYLKSRVNVNIENGDDKTKIILP